jgi:hypothetical protein
MARPFIALLLAVAAVTSAACGLASESASGPKPPSGSSGRVFKRDTYHSTAVASFEAANGWFTAETSLGVPKAPVPEETGPIPVAWAANVPFLDDPAKTWSPDATVRELPPDGIVIVAVGPRPCTVCAAFPSLTLPLKLSDGFFLSDDYEGQRAPNVSFEEIDTWIGADVLNVSVWQGRNEPTAGMASEANGELATLSISG